MMMNDLISLTGSVFMGISKMTNMYFLLLAGRLIIGVSCGTLRCQGKLRAQDSVRMAFQASVAASLPCT